MKIDAHGIPAIHGLGPAVGATRFLRGLPAFLLAYRFPISDFHSGLILFFFPPYRVLTIRTVYFECVVIYYIPPPTPPRNWFDTPLVG